MDKEVVETGLTPEQIKNWRNALTTTLGGYALLMSDERVQDYRDRMQEVIDGKCKALSLVDVQNNEEGE